MSGPTMDAGRLARIAEAARVWADTGPESRDGNCGPLGALDTGDGWEADDWCDRPAGHEPPHLSVDDRDDFLRACLARESKP